MVEHASDDVVLGPRRCAGRPLGERVRPGGRRNGTIGSAGGHVLGDGLNKLRMERASALHRGFGLDEEAGVTVGGGSSHSRCDPREHLAGEFINQLSSHGRGSKIRPGGGLRGEAATRFSQRLGDSISRQFSGELDLDRGDGEQLGSGDAGLADRLGGRGPDSAQEPTGGVELHHHRDGVPGHVPSLSCDGTLVLAVLDVHVEGDQGSLAFGDRFSIGNLVEDLVETGSITERAVHTSEECGAREEIGQMPRTDVQSLERVVAAVLATVCDGGEKRTSLGAKFVHETLSRYLSATDEIDR